MSSVASESRAALLPPLTISPERVRGALLWLTGFSGAFVFVEPSPYEIVSLLTIMVFAASGLSLRASLVPLALLLLLYNAGFAFAVMPVLDQPKALTWMLVSGYLAATTLFFASMLSVHTQARLTLLLRGYIVAAAIAAAVASIGYFRLVPSLTDLFLLYDRARGTFNDPNVLGAFLVLPALFALQRVLTGSVSEAARNGALLLLLLAAELFSFSRGAWAQLAFSALFLMGLTFITSRSPTARLRIIFITFAGALAVVIFVAALLSIEQVAELFKERATLDQSHDFGHSGRFGRHILGFLLALDEPLGIGPLQFNRFFSADPHNAYLNAFVSGGWIAGFSYLTLTLVTIVMGLRFVLVPTPWRSAYQVIYAAYLGVVGESVIIDSDHWRHYFLILGVLWGLMVASRGYIGITDARNERSRRALAYRASAA